MESKKMESMGQSLRAGKVMVGLHVMYPCAGVIERIGPDWDWVWIDGQHGTHSYSTTLDCVRASGLVRRPSIVRVPGHDYGSIGLALDMASAGVMAPMVNSVEEARLLVKAAKFPPLGSRSFGGRRPIDLYGRGYSETANENILLITQIETPEAIEQADEIAAIDGIDVLFIGCDDLARQNGNQMDVPKAGKFEKEKLIVAEAAKKHNKFSGGVFPTAEAAKEAVAMGYQLLASGQDSSFLVRASKQASGDIRESLAGEQVASSR